MKPFFYTIVKDRVLVFLKKLNKNIYISKKIEKYLNRLLEISTSKNLLKVYASIQNEPNGSYQTPLVQIRFLQVLAKSINAQNILEIGTYKGFTAINLAQISSTTKVVTCENNQQNYDDALNLIKENNLENRVQVLSGKATESMSKLWEENKTFDFIYIDADKSNYPAYYDLAIRLTHQGSLIILDNMLWAGLVAEESSTYSHSRILRDLNERIFKTHGKNASFVPAWDGVVIIKVD